MYLPNKKPSEKERGTENILVTGYHDEGTDEQEPGNDGRKWETK